MKISNLQKLCLFAILTLSITTIFLSSETKATDEITYDYYNDSYIDLHYTICNMVNPTSPDWYFSCNSPNIGNWKSKDMSHPSSFDSETGVATYNFDFTNILSSACSNSAPCFIFIKNIQIRPKHNGTFITSDDYDYFYVELYSPYQFYIGRLNRFNPSNWQGLYNLQSGLDVYFYDSANSSSFSCKDLNYSSATQCHFDSIINTQIFDDSPNVYSGFKMSYNANEMTTINNNFASVHSIRFIENYYSTALGHINASYNDSVALYTIDRNNTLTFYLKYANTSEYVVDIDDDINDQDMFDKERDYMDQQLGNASDSNDDIDEQSFTVINPFIAFFNAFADTNCKTFTVLPSWFGFSNSQQICSPWRNNNSIGTAIGNAVSLILPTFLFGFIIGWLKDRWSVSGGKD